jgi:hypothetical protein
MKTNKGKLYFLFIGLIILAFSIVLAILLEDRNPIKTETGVTIFVITQVLVNVIFAGSLIYLALSLKDLSQHVITFVGSLILQLLPLLIRLLVKGDNPNKVLAVIIIFVVMIIYFAIILSMDVLASKMKVAEKELQGREIKVQDIDDYNDENGNFVGANNKKGQK